MATSKRLLIDMKEVKQSLPFFTVFFIITLCMYHTTAGAGFVTDEIGWFETYARLGWKGMFTAFGDRSLHYIYHIAGFLLWRLFRFNGTAWMLIFASLHALVTTVGFFLFKSIFRSVVPTKATVVSFLGSLLFLLSPYQTEVLVWYACVHYLICTLVIS